jgi:hypothetical protein
VTGRLKRGLLAALALAAAIASVRADDYPSRQIELIVPFAPGGGSGLVARMLSDGLAKRFGQAVVVINDVQGKRARLQDRHLVRPVRAGQDSGRDHRLAAQGDGRGFP